MLVSFFYQLRLAQLPVSLTEFLSLLLAMEKRVVTSSVDDFYYLSRTALIKDERHYDRFDKVFGSYFKGMEELFDEVLGEIPEEWLRKQAELMLTDEEKEQIEAMGGWDKLMETLKKRLEEQKGRHEGGNKWIGTAGKSPFGANGYNPEGVRIGQEKSRHRRAVKVWDKREYKNLDDTIEIGTRNIKIALRKLRKFAREGAEDELDLDDTIRSTARNGGMLDIRMVAERHNAVKVLLLLDIGGSMDDHIRLCEELFSAARGEFKHLEHYYFHNCVYEYMWKDNRRRHAERIPTGELIHKYGREYKVVYVGDASMSPYEIAYPGGSVEHWNEEAGAVWMQRLLDTWPNSIWLNPKPREHWKYTQSIALLEEIMGERMFPLTLEGLDDAIKALKRKGVR
ncbi:MAG: VWA domain-containing protein [Chromatiales bacterium]|jgi:uncharacterized protein|nr:VWA domain-containing protein [Chromatiales bacterium]